MNEEDFKRFLCDASRLTDRQKIELGGTIFIEDQDGQGQIVFYTDLMRIKDDIILRFIPEDPGSDNSVGVKE